MSVDIDSYLNAEQKRGILNQRLQQFVVELYQHNLNKKAAELANDTEAVESSTRAVTILENGIKVYQEEFDSLPEPEVTSEQPTE